jgi:hypothetical protein
MSTNRKEIDSNMNWFWRQRDGQCARGEAVVRKILKDHTH